MTQRQVRHTRGARWDLGLALLATLGAAAPAVAQDWPTWRHDFGRSGRAELTGDIETPTPLWSLPLGRSATPPATVTGDYDGDGAAELYYLSAGRLVASRFGRPLLWQSEWAGVDQLAGAWDFDGDGAAELLGVRRSAPSGLARIDVRDGRVLWEAEGLGEGTRELRLRENLLVGDLTGDGLPDLVAVPVSAAPRLVAYSFGAGAPEGGALWSVDLPGATLVSQIVLAEVGGEPVLVVATPSEVNLVDPATGEVLAQLAQPPGFSQPTGLFQVIDPEDDGDAEIACVSVSSTGYGIALFDLAAEEVRWSLAWPTSGHAVAAGPDAVRDFDGDGDPELVLSVFGSAAAEVDVTGATGDHDGVNAPAAWTLLVVDAATGAVETSAEGWLYWATLRAPSGDDVIVARDVSGLEGGAGLSPWSPGAVAALGFDDEGALRRVGSAHAIAPLSRPPSLDERRSTYLRLFAPIGDATRALARADDDLVGVAIDDAGGLAVTPVGALPSGFVAVLDPAWSASGAEAPLLWDAARGFVRLGVSGAIPGPGFRSDALVATGSAEPGAPYLIVARSDGTAAFRELPSSVVSEPLAPDLTIALEGGDVRSMAVAELDGAAGPELFWAGVAAPGVLRMHWLDDTGDHSSRDVRVDGAALRSVTVGPFGEDGAPRVALAVTDVSRALDESERVWVLDEAGDIDVNVGVTRPGRLLGPIVPGPGVAGEATIAVPVTTDLSLRRASDGAEVAAVDTGWASFVVSADTDGDGVLDLIVDDTTELRLIDGATRTQRWMRPKAFPEEGTGTPLGTARRAPEAGLDVVQATAAGELRLYDGATGELVWSVLLDDGAVLPPGAGAAPSISAPVAADVDGDGADEVLVGSSDGFLYALDARDGDPDWVMPLNAPVGAPTVALDGDGRVVILVATSDGFLRGLGQATLDAPAEVREVASRRGAPFEVDEDVDVWDRSGWLSVAWESVAGADQYEVRLVSETEAVVAEWRATPETALYLGDLSLVVGRTYFAQVRALATLVDGTVLASEIVAGDGVFIDKYSGGDVGDVGDAAEPSDMGHDVDLGADLASDLGREDAAISDDLGADAAEAGPDVGPDVGFDVRLDGSLGGMGDLRGGIGVAGDPDGCDCAVAGSQRSPLHLVWLGVALVLLRRRAILRGDA